MTDTAKLVDLVKEIPGEDGFWKSSAEDKYLHAAKVLRAKGMTTEEAVEFLASLYWAAAECYGGC